MNPRNEPKPKIAMNADGPPTKCNPAARPALIRAAGILFLIAFVFGTSHLAAQNYHTRAYGLNDGLPTTRIGGIAQDGKGRMWFSSRSGMIRYTGSSWTRIDQGASTSTRVFDGPCCADADGRVWVSNRHGVARIENDRYVFLPRFPDQEDFRVRQIALSGAGNQTRVLVVMDNNRLYLWTDKQWVTVRLISGAAPDTPAVFSACSAPDGIWIASDTGLFHLPHNSRAALLVKEVPREIVPRGLHYDRSSDCVWLVGKSTISRYNVGDRAFEILHDSLELGEPRNPAHQVLVTTDCQGGLWFGSGFYVYHLNPGNMLRLLRRSNGLGSEGMTAVFHDREHNIWISSARGITRVSQQRFLSYDRTSGLLDDEVSAIGQTRDGVIVLGHQGGLTLLEESGPRLINVRDGTVKHRVVDIHQDAKGELWISCQYAGVGRIAASGQFETDYGFPGIMANGIRFDDTGTAWVATQQGLYKVVGGKLTQVRISDEEVKAAEFIRRLTKGRDGVLYAATAGGGIARIKGGQVQRLPSSPECFNTYTALEALDGSLWAGTADGLALYENGRFTLSTSPRVNRPVYSLLQDTDQNIWIGTDNGVYRWNGEELRHFTSKKGLLGAETNRGALFEDRDGRVWIGTARGLSRFEHSNDIDHPVKPLVFLTDLEAGGERRPLNGGVTLPSSSRDVTFSFEASSFVDEDNVRFRSYLENYDEEWSAPQLLPLREVRYTNLPAGEYRLHLKAIDIEDRESKVVVSDPIVIEKHVTEQPWFLVLCALTFFALTWSGFAFLNQRRYSQALERQVEIRAAELQQAERANAQLARLESLGVLAGGIAHDFNNALTVISGFVTMIDVRTNPDGQTRDYVRKIEGACERAQSLTRQLLTFSKGGAPNRELSSLEHIIREAAGFSLLGSNVECAFDFPADLPAVDVDIGQFHQVFNNLTINARQAMPGGGKLRFSAREIPGGSHGTRILIRVEDEGSGIAPEIRERVFDPYFTTKSAGSGLGLSIVHSIVSNHGGTIIIENNESKGTTFVITIPASDDVLPHEVEKDNMNSLEVGRVLVLDDEPGIRILISDALGSHGCEVTTVRDGEEAVQAYRDAMAQDRPFCAVITDLTIPGGMGGAEASKEILALDPEAYLIVTTGYANEPILANYVDYGFADKLPKPFSIEDLVATVSRAPRRGLKSEKS